MDASKNLAAQGAPFAGGPGELVSLDREHPGFRDPLYRRRRDQIAALAMNFREGDPVPEVEYTPMEHGVWETVWRELEPAHEDLACGRYLKTLGRLNLDRKRIPQLAEINEILRPRGGIRFMPVAGLVSEQAFLNYMGRGIFLSTQYIRHASRPLYTPEPDVVHELIGHAVTLADPKFAALNRRFGWASVCARSDEALARIARLYWYTVEFGAVREGGTIKAYGAGLLSSSGELRRFGQDAELRPLDPAHAMARPYDPTDYQAVIYVADSLDQMEECVTRALDRETDG